MYTIHYSILPSKEAYPTLRVRGEDGTMRYIHSKYYPSKESAFLHDIVNPEKYDSLIIIGIGLGYHLLYLCDKVHLYRQIICIDIHDYLTDAKIPHEIQSFLKHSSIQRHIVPPGEPEQLLNVLQLDYAKGVQVIEHPALFNAFPSSLYGIKSIISKIVQKSISHQLTASYFSYRYFKNALLNIRKLHACYPVQQYRNSHSHQPCIVIAPGPSLEGLLQPIYRHREKVCIIAADSAVSILLSHNIQPDYIVSVDPQPIVHAHLFSQHYHCKLITTLTAHSTAFCKPAIVSLNTHPVCQLIDELFPHAIGSVDSKTGTVLGDALCFAVLAGFNPIGIAGADFSFPHYTTYSRCTEYQYRYALSHTRAVPLETSNINYIMYASRKNVVNQKYSRKVFVQYRDAIDAMFPPETTVYHIHPIGLKLSTAVHISILDFLHLPHAEQYTKTQFHPAPSPIGTAVDTESIANIFRNETMLANLLEASKVYDSSSIARALKLLHKE